MKTGEGAAEEWRRGWPLVLSATAGYTVGPLGVYTMSLYIRPLQEEFGWSKAFVTSGLMVNALVAVTLSTIAGMAIDRFGPRRIGIAGVICFCTSLALFATNSGAALHWWALWMLLALSMLAAKPTVWVAAITSRFDRSVGLALATVMCGSTVTTTLGPLIAGWAIAEYGWRISYILTAGIWGAAALPLLFLFFFGQSDLNRTRRSGAQVVRTMRQGSLAGGPAMLKSPIYLRIVLACALSQFIIAGTIVNLEPILTSDGLDRPSAIYLISMIGVSMFMGRLIAGYWLDRHNPALFGALCFGIPAVAFAVLLLSAELNIATGLCVVMAIGFATGAEFEQAAFMINRIFGQSSFGMLVGTILAVLAVGQGTGPMLFGYIFDQSGSYRAAFAFALPISLLASLLIYSVGSAVRRAPMAAATF
ncbi:MULTISPECIES: MFS transporter [unclassified Sphingobium]|uniref:MFS transporter n=1 Tax=unclassified Sphingobium TaxID=2611147 RepID=UPI00119B069F|nr:MULTISPECIES: MFS transporter [unclassified Sphingobium]MBG6119931.1 putative MFS family arabinose efflux permease [Sphingobium sp. JAI105]TWC96524.1 putative MFS family arabinose efflux permease [Sphingobium sp. AEW010]TWD16407.1 putative MFS family arabinose efflux permease [Sphingobium sp. AEW013]TWD19280.1 putative MFS family arabinose efflux permease [Sphingobium sp. AEW001]